MIDKMFRVAANPTVSTFLEQFADTHMNITLEQNNVMEYFKPGG